MINSLYIALIVLFLLAVSAAYVGMAKHPCTKILASLLIFLTIVAAVTGGLFFGALSLVSLLGYDPILTTRLTFALLASALVPGFFVARWQIRKPPLPAPRI